MSVSDLIALLPLLIVAATTIVAMLLIAFSRRHRATAVVTALSYRYLEPAGENREEYYLLVLMGALGAGG